MPAENKRRRRGKLLAVADGWQCRESGHPYDFDNKADFSKSKTYKWVTIKDAPKVDDLTDKQIKAALDTAFVTEVPHQGSKATPLIYTLTIRRHLGFLQPDVFLETPDFLRVSASSDLKITDLEISR